MTDAKLAVRPSVRESAPAGALAPLDTHVRANLTARQSANTRKAYAWQWQRFARWCTAHDATAGPPTAPLTVARYLSALAADGLTVATIRLASAAIADRHTQADLDSPTADRGVRATVAGIARRYGQPQRQAQALTPEAIAAIRATAATPRRGGRGGQGWESAARVQRRAAFDIALCEVLGTGGLRRSEAAALQWRHIAVWADGSGRVTIARSKTDAEGAGAEVYITPSAVQALTDHCQALHGVALADAPADAPVWPGAAGQPLTAASLGRHVTEAARHAGLGTGYTGHSGRVGMARRMVSRGAPLAVVQRQGRWQTGDMVTRYTRGEQAGEAGRYLDDD